MSLNGNISDFSALEALQVVALQRKTGTLEFESGRARRELHVLSGDLAGCRPTRAEDPDPLLDLLSGLGRLPADAHPGRAGGGTAQGLHASGLDVEALAEAREAALRRVLEEVLLWDRGRFRFTPHAVALEEGQEPWNADQALLDSLRRLDELPDLRAEGFPSDSAPRRTGGPGESDAAWGGLEEEIERSLLRLADGNRSLGELRKMLGVSEWDLLHAARSLRSRGRLEMGARREEPTQAAPVFERQRAPRSTPFVLGVALLAACVLGLGAGANAVEQSAGLRAEAGSRAERAAFDRERALRYALEVRKIRAGEYPESLARLVAEGIWPDRRAAELEGFAYARSGTGYDLWVSDPADASTRRAASSSPSQTKS